MEKKETVLVTGGTGFVAQRLILQLLQKGYNVRTTVRNLKSKDKVVNALSSNGIKSFRELTFIEAELTKDDNWEEAMEGCKYVFSIASPVFFEIPKDEAEAIRPAVEGIYRVLKFARQVGIKRVVMTSNFGAVGFSHTDKKTETTEADWTDTNMKGLSVYEKSKTLAERAAWDFIRREGGELEFATVNPVAIYGPSLDEHISGSFHLLSNLLDGSMKVVPHLPLNIVDVRDVADLHIRAMMLPEANGQRFIATADGQITLSQITKLLKNKRPDAARKVSTLTIPNWMVYIASLFNPRAREAAVFLRMNRNVSNRKAREILDWKPIATQEQAILEAVDSMIKFNLIK